MYKCKKVCPPCVWCKQTTILTANWIWLWGRRRKEVAATETDIQSHPLRPGLETERTVSYAYWHGRKDRGVKGEVRRRAQVTALSCRCHPQIKDPPPPGCHMHRTQYRLYSQYHLAPFCFICLPGGGLPVWSSFFLPSRCCQQNHSLLFSSCSHSVTEKKQKNISHLHTRCFYFFYFTSSVLTVCLTISHCFHFPHTLSHFYIFLASRVFLIWHQSLLYFWESYFRSTKSLAASWVEGIIWISFTSFLWNFTKSTQRNTQS